MAREGMILALPFPQLLDVMVKPPTPGGLTAAFDRLGRVRWYFRFMPHVGYKRVGGDEFVTGCSFHSLRSAGSQKVAEKICADLNGKVKLEDAGFDWKASSPPMPRPRIAHLWQKITLPLDVTEEAALIKGLPLVQCRFSAQMSQMLTM